MDGSGRTKSVLAFVFSGLNSSFQGLKEGDGEERDRFWNETDRTLDSVLYERSKWMDRR